MHSHPGIGNIPQAVEAGYQPEGRASERLFGRQLDESPWRTSVSCRNAGCRGRGLGLAVRQEPHALRRAPDQQDQGRVRKIAPPESSAAERQPSFRTASATRGKSTTPPIAWPVCRMDMARPRLVRNQWFTAAMEAWLKPT